jgi:hypothetical protein
VTAVVVGDGGGQGRCLLYASGRDRNLLIAADSGVLALRPGLDLVWDVTVETPAAQEFDGWNLRGFEWFFVLGAILLVGAVGAVGWRVFRK